MPVERICLAGDDALRVERVTAPGHGPQWGALHRSPNRRWVLPGTGGVQWRCGDEQLLVDELTAFRLAPGEHYQLQHERARSHLVLSGGAEGDTAAALRAWRVGPRELYRLRLAARALRDGVALASVAAEVDAALAVSTPLSARGAPAALLRARRFVMAEPAAGHSLEVLGEAAACSPFHLSRLFAQHLRLSPQRYRTHLRLAASLAWLESGERDLAGLAHDLGFASQSHFGAVFHQSVGVTPADARRALGGDRRTAGI